MSSFESLPAYLNIGASKAADFGRSVCNHEKIAPTAQKISDFVKDNYAIIFSLFSAWSFLSAPLPFTFIGLTSGCWLYDKEITINPGNTVYKIASLLDEENHIKLVIASLVTRFFISVDLAGVGIGFLTGCSIRKFFTG
ncbi:MAG: hypothetical protein JWO53_648 [Chlamydiia bacterium]|nr:hypothetical protein [Chlamydiia bacterium]